MNKDCEHNNLLIRGGTSQGERFPSALNTAYIKVDERRLLELLVFFKKFSGELSYYDLDNKADGTWEVFFSDNVAGRLADIATFNIKVVINVMQEISESILTGPTYKKALKSQFDLLFTLLYKTEVWSKNSLAELLIYQDLYKEISATLSLELERLVSYYKKAVDINLINPDQFTQNSTFALLPSENILQVKGFPANWFRFTDEVTGEAYKSWSDYYDAIDKSEIYDPKGTTAQRAAYSQSFLLKSMERITSSFTRLAQNTDAYIDDILENYSAHEPHIGLLLAFLNLFRHAQNEINSITERHLDYYLKEVLQLDHLAPVPDKAHVVFEVAKDVDKVKIAKDTALSAGKDSLGKEILFYTAEESIVNKASIDSIRNIYIAKQDKHHIFAAPNANSPDGLGAKFEEDPGKWNAFGEAQSSLDSRSMPDASIGFLITADILHLKEGQRKISIDIACATGTIENTSGIGNAELQLSITGEKGWITRKHNITKVNTASGFGYNDGIFLYQNTLRFNITLNASDSPVVDLDNKLHDTRFPAEAPGIFVECINTNNKPSAYHFFKNVIIQSITISAEAGSKSDFLLQNDQVVIDPSKPFMPFGSSPMPGSSLLIGSSNIFNSELKKLTLHGTWNGLPEEGLQSYYSKLDSTIDHQSFTANRQSLRDGKWETASADASQGPDLFKGDKDDEFEFVFHDGSGWDVSPVAEGTEKYDIKSTGGFIKIELDNNSGFAFGHKAFPGKYAEEAIKQSAGAAKADDPSTYVMALPNEPYTPVLSDFYISFKSVAEIKVDSNSKSQYTTNPGKIFQVHPFGYHELHPYLQLESLFLFPQFSHETETTDTVKHNGQLLIGLKDLDAPSSINILFKVAEGSEDPELQQESISWFYLAKDKWVAFRQNEVLADNTRNLTTSGILSLSIPKEATDNNTILPGEYIYLMGAIEKNTAATCKIIDLHPQSILTGFKDNKNDPARTGIPMVAKSIAKLKVKDPKIKSVLQPYASFGGKTKESSEGFYRRTAERLRHKLRGITIWDYERLILEAFPDIYKVKCINHTAYGHYQSLGTSLDAEFAPGYVTLIVIPTTYNQNAINPYEPRVTKARILDIEKYVKSRISTFAAENLKVLNPLYEQIQLEFSVEFYPEYADRGYYEKQLNEDIKKYLAPWAYTSGKEITLGGKLHRSTLIDFVEELYYVDYLTDFKMHRYVDGGNKDYNIELALPTTARSSFVTINDKDYKNEHKITEISE